MSTIQKISNANLSQVAKRTITEFTKEEKKNYTELLYKTDKARENALAQLKDILGEQNYNFTTKVKKGGNGEEYFAIEIRKVKSEEKNKQIPKKEEEIKPNEKVNVEKQYENMGGTPSTAKGTKTKQQKLEEIFGKKVGGSIIKHSEKYDVDPFVIAAIIVAENSKDGNKWEVDKIGERLKKDPNHYSKTVSSLEISSKDSYGLPQFIKPTLKPLLEGNDTFEGVIADYDKSIKYMAKFISGLQKNANGLEEIAFAYNAGPGALQKLKNEGGDWKDNLKGKLKQHLRGTYKIGSEYIEKAKRAYEQLQQL